MSAWVVSKRHIDALVTGLLRKRIVSGDPTELGKQLWQENVNSIQHRYPDTLETDSNYPGPCDFKAASVRAYRYERVQSLSCAQLLDFASRVENYQL